jgi:hypothetical protein
MTWQDSGSPEQSPLSFSFLANGCESAFDCFIDLMGERGRTITLEKL